MAIEFDSFDSSPFDAFIQSFLGDARGKPKTDVLISIGEAVTLDPFSTDYGACYSLDKNEIKAVGDATLEGELTDIEEYRERLYVCGVSLYDSNFIGSVAIFDKDTGKFDNLHIEDFVPEIPLGMTVWNDLLITVGTFTEVIIDGGYALDDTYQGCSWNGTDYGSIGLRFDDSPWLPFSTPSQCISYDDFLIASGDNIVRKYSGGGVGSWSKLASTDSDPSGDSHTSLYVHKNRLYMGGREFLRSWATGESTYTDEGTIDQTGGTAGIYAMTTYKGDLIVGGFFDDIDGVSALNVARKDSDGVWHEMGSGIGQEFGAFVHDLKVDSKGFLVAGGDFTKNGDGDDVKGLAVWDVGQEKWVETDEKILSCSSVGLLNFTGDLEP